MWVALHVFPLKVIFQNLCPIQTLCFILRQFGCTIPVSFSLHFLEYDLLKTDPIGTVFVLCILKEAKNKKP